MINIKEQNTKEIFNAYAGQGLTVRDLMSDKEELMSKGFTVEEIEDASKKLDRFEDLFMCSSCSCEPCDERCYIIKKYGKKLFKEEPVSIGQISYASTEQLVQELVIDSVKTGMSAEELLEDLRKGTSL